MYATARAPRLRDTMGNTLKKTIKIMDCGVFQFVFIVLESQLLHIQQHGNDGELFYKAALNPGFIRLLFQAKQSLSVF